MRVELRRILGLAAAAWLAAGLSPVLAQTSGTKTRWFLAEGATGSFDEQILIANPTNTDATITITYLPDGPQQIQPQHLTVPAHSRYTVDADQYVLSQVGYGISVSARVESDQPVMVERSMYWPPAGRMGGHNAAGILDGGKPKWYLGEGSTGMFDTYILVANVGTSRVRVVFEFLREGEPPYVFDDVTLQPNQRYTLNAKDHPQLQARSFGVVVRSVDPIDSTTPTGEIVVERAMYFRGAPGAWDGGHGTVAVNSPANQWHFGEGSTGTGPGGGFDTYLLLGNPNDADAGVTVKYLLEGAPSVDCEYTVKAKSRLTVPVNALHIPTPPNANPQYTCTTTSGATGFVLDDRSFSIDVTSDQDIVAERAMYWGPPWTSMPFWRDGHATAGVTALSTAWAFAEGIDGRPEPPAGSGAPPASPNDPPYSTYFLIANPNPTPLTVVATFYREDATGVQKTITVPAESRFTLEPVRSVTSPAYASPELAHQRFGAFFESEDGQPFVVERAVYWGTSWDGGHASAGIPWEGEPVVKPPTPPAPTMTSISPASGPMIGGTLVTIHGTDFGHGATVTFGGVPATQVQVLTSRILTALTPASGVEGAVDVRVSVAGREVVKTGAYTYSKPIVESVSPASGPTTGGTTITITGQYFRSGATVAVGGMPATVTNITPTTITAITSPRAAGIVPVSVTIGGHTGTRPSAFNYVRTTATDNILSFGDSITYGTTERDRRIAGYPGRLQNLLRANYPAQAPVVQGAGVPGEWSSQGKKRLPSVIAAHHDLVIILEGINDLNNLAAPQAVWDALKAMIGTARQSGKRVIVTTLLPVFPNANGTYEGDPFGHVDETNALIRTNAAAAGATLVDMNAAFASTGNPRAFISSDGLHPNDAGYQLMAEVYLNAIVANFEAIPPVVP